ncbi:MAG: DUF11 domain-containing protein [Planctomycetaceae bacterium]|nr:DUF11 domain-containing protein [Planctomycetaceae bacterium]
MPTKHPLFAIAIVSLLATAVCAQAQTKDTNQTETTSRRVQSAAPVIHRRATLPAGWFDQAKKPAALSDPQQTGATPAAHFDTTGKDEQKPKGVSNRLRQIQRSVVFDQIKPVENQPKSSRRQNSVRNPKRNKVASSNQSPSKLAKGQASKDPVAQKSSTAATTEDTAVQPTESTAAKTAIKTGAAVPQEPVVNKAEETVVTAPISAGNDVTNLPSVMKQPTVQEAVSQDSTTRVAHKPTSPKESVTAETQSVKPEAVETLAARPRVDTPKADKQQPPPVQETKSDETVLITNESPVLSVTTRGPRTIVVGKESIFEFDLTNSGKIDAKDVTVKMNVPHWVEVVQQQASLGSTRIEPDEQGDSAMSWSVARLNGGAAEKLKLRIIPRGSRPLDLGVTWTFMPAQTTAQIQVQEPKLEMSVIGPQDVLFGETKIYTITVSNPGTGDAENVILNLMPLVPSEKTAGVRNIGTIKAGTRRTIEVELTARQTGRLQVRAETSADGGLQAQGAQDVLVRRAVLEVAVAGPPMKYAGTRARFAIRVTNSGDATARDVVAIATLPAGSKNVSSSAGGNLDANHGQVQWQVGSVRPGATRVLELECILVSPGNNRLDMRAIAQGDISALGSTVTAVESLADLKMTVDDPHGAVAVGDDVTYEIRIQNRGTKAASDIQLFGFFSEGIEPAGIRGWRGTVTEGEVIIERIPRLGAGQEMVVKITAQAHRAGDHVFRAELECVDPETKLAVEEWTRFFGDVDPIRQAEHTTESPASR